MDKEYLSIGELARKMGVTVRTLQYYDKEGLLKPSALSEGGRRLYSAKDIVRLHQILSFKYLGFSLEEIKSRIFNLDTPEKVAAILNQQKKAIQEQIEELTEALNSIERFRNEVIEMESVDFKKYAEIIELLKMENKEYWVWKHFDEDLTTHIKERYSENPENGLKIFDTYKEVLQEAYQLKSENEKPDNKKSLALAEKWWNMVMEFTGGDMSLLSKLESFNDKKEDWNNDLADIQKEVDEYLQQALGCYFVSKGIEFPQG